jgi:hypothetical protein
VSELVMGPGRTRTELERKLRSLKLLNHLVDGMKTNAELYVLMKNDIDVAYIIPHIASLKRFGYVNVKPIPTLYVDEISLSNKGREYLKNLGVNQIEGIKKAVRKRREKYNEYLDGVKMRADGKF